MNGHRKSNEAIKERLTKQTTNAVIVVVILKVSWMRKRDMHILSVDKLMYSTDMRFHVIHPDKSENWTLQIKTPQQRDSGIYECQVSTEPKMSLNYSLNVVGEWCYFELFRRFTVAGERKATDHACRASCSLCRLWYLASVNYESNHTEFE